MEENQVNLSENTAAETASTASEDAISNETEKAVKPENKILIKLRDLFSAEKRKKTIIGLIIALVVICVVIGTISYLSPKSVAQRYVKADILGDLRTIFSLSAEDTKAYFTYSFDDEDEFFEAASDYYDADVNSWSSFCRVANKDEKEHLEDTYGKYSYSSEVTKTRTLTTNKLIEFVGKSYISKLETKAGFDSDQISKGMLVTVKTKIKGEDMTDRDTANVYLAKIGGFWKVLYFEYD